MNGYVFEQFQDVTGHATDNKLVMRIVGPEDSIRKIKKNLTIVDKGVKWKVKNAIDKIAFFERKFKDGPMPAKISATIRSYEILIKNETPNITKELFTEIDGRTLDVPSGFWKVCGQIEGTFHLNTEFKPVFIDGLRDYQKETITEMIRYKRATGVLATGLGKSHIILSIALSAVASGKRAAIVVPTEYLVEQTYNLIKQYHANSTALGGKYKTAALGADIVVTTTASAKKVISPYHIVIIDESQHSPCTTLVDLIVGAENTTHVYNLTATAFRSDGLDLMIHSFGGPVVYERDVKWGIQNGWLKKLVPYSVTLKYKDKNGKDVFLSPHINRNRAYKALVANPGVYTYVKEMLLKAVAKGRKSMVIFKSVEACEGFAEFCKPELDIAAAHATYKKPLSDFAQGKTMVLVGTDRLISEGVDIPNASALFLLTQHASDVTTFQSVGRVLRKGDFDNAVLIDVTVAGFKEFESFRSKRAKVYSYIADSITVLDDVEVRNVK